jgi:hypothetical protein
MTRFSFNAAAAAAGGFLTRPFNEPIPVQAASCLTPAGGYGSARVEHFNYRQILSFKAAYTVVMGTRRSEKNNAGADVDVFDTLALAVIEDLNILGVVTADRIVARITSQHRSDAASPEMTASPIGSSIENLKIAGQTLSPMCDPRLFDFPTKSKIVEAKLAAELGAPVTGRRPASIPSSDDTLRFSIFPAISQKLAGMTPAAGGKITVPSVGDLFLGELIVTGAERKLSMLRIELHSPEEGEVVVGVVQGNGSGY